MKKLIALLLALAMMTILLCACENKEKNSTADAYLSMAQGFLDKNDIDAAIDILNKGFSETNDPRLSEKLLELYAQHDNTKNTGAPATEPPATTPPISESAGTTPPETTPPETTSPATTPPETTPPPPTHTHSYNKKVTAATCTAQGYTTYTCSCGDSYKGDYTNPKNHSYSSKVTAATCTAQGYTTHTCSSCSDTYKDSYTNPSHSYTSYKCTKCGTVDKSHAYEYLIEWVKKNGVADGSHINFDYRVNGDNYVRYGLTYDASGKYLYVNCGSYHQDEYCFEELRLDTYYCYVSFLNNTVSGQVSASEFTSNSPIMNVQYQGNSADKWDMIELARLSANNLIEWLTWCLDAYNVGITIADLGFTAYK